MNFIQMFLSPEENKKFNNEKEIFIYTHFELT